MIKRKMAIYLNIMLFTLESLIFTADAQSSSIAITPDPAFMGKIPIGSTQSKNFDIVNLSSNSMNISNIKIAGPGADRYVITNNPNSVTVNSYDQITVNVVYTPASQHQDIAYLQFQAGSEAIIDTITGYGTQITNGIPNFERIIGLQEDVKVSAICQTADSGFAIVGTTMLFSNIHYDVFLVKTDKYGKELWHRIFEYGAGDTTYDSGDDQGWDVLALNDGDIIVLGDTRAGGPGSISVFLSKWDSKGNEIWEKAYGGIYDDIAQHIILSSDGDFVLVGHTNNTSDQSENSMVMKIDPDGNLVWNKNYGTPGIESAYDIVQTPDGGYIFVGNNQNPTANIYFVKLDASGNEQWQNTLTSSATSEGSVIQSTSDGGYIVSGYTLDQTFGMQGYLVKVDDKGQEQWAKSYGGEHVDYFSSVVQTADNGYLAVGSINQYFSIQHTYDDIWLEKTDSQGNEQWRKRLGGALNDDGYDVIKTKEGGYAIIGITSSYSSVDKIYFTEMDIDSSATGVKETEGIAMPKQYSLSQNYPNPFNPSTTIRYQIPKSGYVELKVYDLLGNEVKTLVNEDKPAGQYSVKFNANNLSSGVYFYRIVSGNYTSVKKMLLLK